jgi:hypothetical protein
MVYVLDHSSASTSSIEDANYFTRNSSWCTRIGLGFKYFEIETYWTQLDPMYGVSI